MDAPWEYKAFEVHDRFLTSDDLNHIAADGGWELLQFVVMPLNMKTVSYIFRRPKASRPGR